MLNGGLGECPQAPEVRNKLCRREMTSRVGDEDLGRGEENQGCR